VRILEYGIKNQEARLEWLHEFFQEIEKDKSFDKRLFNKQMEDGTGRTE
jgi:hypothetical protein